MHWETIVKKATELGAELDHGINWKWATWRTDDPNAGENAKVFCKWCAENDLETRGVYPPHNGEGFGVRFRQ